MTRTENFDAKLYTSALIASINAGESNALNEDTLRRVGLNPKEYKEDINTLYRALRSDNLDLVYSVWRFLVSLLDGKFRVTNIDIELMKRSAMGITRKTAQMWLKNSEPDGQPRELASVTAPASFRAIVELILGYRAQNKVIRILDDTFIVEELREKTRKERRAAKIAKAERRKAEKAKKQAAQPKEEANDAPQEKMRATAESKNTAFPTDESARLDETSHSIINQNVQKKHKQEPTAKYRPINPMELIQCFHIMRQHHAMIYGASIHRGFMYGIDDGGFWYSQGRCNATPVEAQCVQIFRQTYNSFYHTMEYRPFWEKCTESYAAYLVREYMIAHPEKRIAHYKPVPEKIPIETRGLRMTKQYDKQHGSPIPTSGGLPE